MLHNYLFARRIEHLELRSKEDTGQAFVPNSTAPEWLAHEHLTLHVLSVV